MYKKRKSTRTQLIKAIDTSTTTLYNALAKLKKLGLIQEKKKATFPFTVEVSLTQKGQTVARQVIVIERGLSEAVH